MVFGIIIYIVPTKNYKICLIVIMLFLSISDGKKSQQIKSIKVLCRLD